MANNPNEVKEYIKKYFADSGKPAPESDHDLSFTVQEVSQERDPQPLPPPCLSHLCPKNLCLHPQPTKFQMDTNHLIQGSLHRSLTMISLSLSKR